jgi:hypothetical protein
MELADKSSAKTRSECDDGAALRIDNWRDLPSLHSSPDSNSVPLHLHLRSNLEGLTGA